MICGVGGFALVFIVRSLRSDERFALKRLCVNSEQDLAIARREIQIAVSQIHYWNLQLLYIYAYFIYYKKIFKAHMMTMITHLKTVK